MFDALFKRFKFTNGPLEESKNWMEFWQRFTFFLTCSGTLHGVRHFSSPALHLFEVIFWGIVIGAATTCCCFTSVIFLHRYLTHPTVLTLERDYQNWNVSFPSISICLHDKINETALQRYLDERKPKNRQVMDKFLRKLVNITLYNLGDLPDCNEISPHEYIQAINVITNRVEGNLITEHNHSFTLETTVTQLGTCSQFNSKIGQYFTASYINNGEILQDVSVHMTNFITNDYSASITINAGCDIYYHNENELINPRQVYRIDYKHSALYHLTFRATPVHASEQVKFLFAFQRNCRFNDENNLLYFSHYYKGLCEGENRLTRMLAHCNCVPFFFAGKKELFGNFKPCFPKDFQCIHRARPHIELELSKMSCKADCNRNEYQLISHRMSYWNGSTTLKVELEPPRVRIKYDVLYSLIHLITMIGATSNLFLGISFLSLVNLLFMWCMYLPRRYYRFKKCLAERKSVRAAGGKRKIILC